MISAIPEKYRKYVVTDLPKYVEVVGHHHPAPLWIVPQMFPGANIGVAGTDASKMVNAPHADPHIHEDFPEIYLAVTENRGEIVCKIQMNDNVFTVESPFAVFIPPGTKHCFTVLKCDSPNWIYGITIRDWKKP